MSDNYHFFCKKCNTSFKGTKEEVKAFKIAHYLRSKKNPRFKVCANLYETANQTIARPDLTVQIGKEKRLKDRENETFSADWENIHPAENEDMKD